MGRARHLILLMILLLGACTLRGAVNAVTPKEDRAFAHEMVSRLRHGDQAWLRQRFAPELWAQSGAQLGAVPAMFPGEGGNTELIGFNISTNFVNGRTQRSKQFTLATEGDGRWTMTNFRTYSTGGPEQVVQWSVVPYSSRPPEVAMIDTMEAALPWFWGGMAATLCGIAALIFWLVRRSRRKHDPWAGRRGGASGPP